MSPAQRDDEQLDEQLDRAALAYAERFPLAELRDAEQLRAAVAYAERWELRRAH